MCREVHNLDLLFVKRHGNLVADALAKLAFVFPNSLWLENPIRWLVSFDLADVNIFFISN